jgi:hypothetical protein
MGGDAGSRTVCEESESGALVAQRAESVPRHGPPGPLTPRNPCRGLRAGNGRTVDGRSLASSGRRRLRRLMRAAKRW